MKLIDLVENDIEHQKTLQQTGFWGSAGAGGILISNDTNNILLGLRSRMVEQPGTWAGFGGAIDSTEDPKQAALREIVEETGLTQDLIDSVSKSYVYEDPKTNFKYTNYIIEVKNEFKPRLNWENEDAQWFSISNLPPNKHFGLQSLLNSSEFKTYWNNRK